MSPVDLSSIIIDGKPVTKLYPGWKALARLKITPELEIVHFRELENGKDALWWLDKEGRHIASHAMALSEEQKNRLLAYLEPLMAPLQMNMQRIMPEPLPPEAEEIRTLFLNLPYVLLFELVTVWCSIKISQTLTFSPEEIVNISMEVARDHPVSFSQERIRETLATSFSTTQCVMAPSPFSKASLSEQLKFRVPGGPFARFIDQEAQVVFYLFWLTRHAPEDYSPENTDVVFSYPRERLLIGDSRLASLVPLWLMLFFLFYNDRLSALPSEGFSLPFPKPLKQAIEQTTSLEPSVVPWPKVISELTSNPEANIPLDDLKKGTISNLWDITQNNELPPMALPAGDDLPLPFTPFPDQKSWSCLFWQNSP